MDSLVVKIPGVPPPSDKVVIRDMEESTRLDGKDYRHYRIVQPRGFEEEIIYHRIDRGLEALLAVVFLILAEDTAKKPARSRNRRPS